MPKLRVFSGAELCDFLTVPLQCFCHPDASKTRPRQCR